MKHILLYRESKLSNYQRASNRETAFCLLPEITYQGGRLFWLTCLAIFLAVGNTLAQCPPAVPTSTLTASTNCTIPNGTISFSGPNTSTHVFSIDGGTNFGVVGQTTFTNLAPGVYQTVAKNVAQGCVSSLVSKTITVSSVPVAPTSSVMTTTCSGPTGTITFSAPTPVSNYQFSVDGGASFGSAGQTVFTGLAAGNYATVVKLVSTGCVSTTAIKTITVAAAPVAPTSTAGNVTNCNTPNGSITFTAPTPLANYVFSVDGGATFGATGQTVFTGLAPDIYQTVVKSIATGCVSLTTAAATKTVAVSGTLATPTSTVTPTSCTAATGIITFTAPTPVANYQFSVDGGASFGSAGQTAFTGLAADNYYTVVKSVATGCVSVVTVKSLTTVTAPAGPTSTVTTVTNCNSPNGIITFSAPALASHLFSIDGGQTYGLSGQTVFTQLAPGSYETMAVNTTTGCESPVVIKTIVPATAVPTPTSSLTNVSSCLPNNGRILFTAPTPVANYQFSIDGGQTFGTAGQTSFPNLEAGTYQTVAKLVSTGCVSTSTPKSLTLTTEVSVPSFVGNNGQNNCATPGSIIFSAPSPATHVFSVDGGATYGSLGQVVFSGLTAGTYVLRAKLVSTGCESPVVGTATVNVACNNVEICGNGVDDDGDGFIDQFDSDCPCTTDGFVNVCQPDCEYNPNSTKPFTIKKQFSTSTAATSQVAVYQTPMVADVDADGVVELVGIGISKIVTPDNVGSRSTKDILIFNGKTGALERTISTGNFWINWSVQSQLAIGNTDKSDAQAEIYTITHSNTGIQFLYNNPTAALTCYKADGTLLWRNTTNLISAGLNGAAVGPAIGLADFNGDGIAEVYVFNKIYNAVTGALLVNGATIGGTAAGIGGGYAQMSVAADLTAHPGLELAAGKSVYEITITNPNGTAGNSIVEKRMPSPYLDGKTSLADIDLDGQLDVVVRYGTSLYVYDPRTMGFMASTTVPNNSEGNNGGNTFIGDVDNDGDPDIGVTGSNYIGMYSYNGTSTLVLKWSKTTTDGSGVTGITMFDFNQDGKQELVYRDESNLRIMDGTTGNDIVTFPSKSGTGFEMPVVADVDGDGQANIIVTSGLTLIAGVIDVFSTASFPWAPTREVWNQVGYNVTNVNDDLTIPAKPQDNSVVFSNGKRVLNNFLQQSTIYDKEGNPVFPAVNVKIVFNPDATETGTGYAKASKAYFTGVCENSLPVSASLTIPLVNGGNIPTPANMPVSIYRGDPFNSASAVLVQTITVTNPIAANGGTFTTGTTINTTGFTAPFKLYVVPGDPGATSSFPLNINTYFSELDQGYCSSARNMGVYGEFSCTCPTITNRAADNLSPVTCGSSTGSITVCGLTPNGSGYTVNYTKNGVSQPAQTSLTASESGCLNLTGLSAGTYTNISVSNAGCADGSNAVGPISLTAPSAPAAPMVNATSLTICSGDPVNLNYTTTPAGQTVQWIRLPESYTGVGNITDYPTAIGATPVSYTYTARTMGTPGCESPVTTSIITVNPRPTITPSQCSQTICAGQTGSITFDSTIPGTIINWLRVNDGVTGQGNISQVFATAVTYTYRVWGTSPTPAACPSSTTITCQIVVTPGLDVTALVAAGSGCIGSPLSLSASVIQAGSYTYSWAGPNGYVGSGANPQVATAASITNNGSYTVTVTGTSGCLGTATVPVSVSSCCGVLPTANSNSPQCAGNQLQLNAYTQGGSGNFTYRWSGPNGFGSTLANPTIPNATTAATGSYTVIITDATTANCSFTVTTPVTIATQPNLVITGSPSLTICSGQSTTLSVAGSNGAPVSWTSSTGQTGTGVSVNTGVLINYGTQPYTLVYRFSADAGTCSDSSTVLVTVNPEPSLQIRPVATVYCNIEQVNITASASPAASVINWTRTPGSPNPPVASGSGTGTVSINEQLPASSYTFSFTATNPATGCVSQPTSIPITVQQ